MRELHVVAVSEDGQSVVLATSRGATRGGFRVAIDDRLTAALQGDVARPADTPPVDVTPKQIQARLRAGESVEQIAATAGVPIGKIERYAGPVLSERERVLDQARSGYVTRSRLGASALPVGEAVDRHLADTTGVRPESIAWSARREEVGTWVVAVSYVSQARRRTATWRYDVARREVTATDSASAQLAHVEPGHAARGGDAVLPAPATPSERRAKPQSRRPASEPTRRTAPAARTVVARPDGAGGAAADRAAHAAAAAAQTGRQAKVAAERAAARKAQAAAAAAPRKAKADRDRTAKATAESGRRARAEAARQAKAQADRKAKAEAARKAKAEADRKATAEAARKAKAEAARKAKAAAARQAAAKVKAAAAGRLEREAERAREAVVAQAPYGPPTLRVVGGDDGPPRRGGAKAGPTATPKATPAAARTAPARAAGQRASVPGWADVLLSTAPVRSSDAGQDQD